MGMTVFRGVDGVQRRMVRILCEKRRINKVLFLLLFSKDLHPDQEYVESTLTHPRRRIVPLRRAGRDHRWGSHPIWRTICNVM